jgi:hypothetical protein
MPTDWEPIWNMSEIELETDARELRHPIAIFLLGKETSIKTIGSAVQFLSREKAEASSEWRIAYEALCAAHEDYTPGHRDLATKALELFISSRRQPGR